VHLKAQDKLRAFHLGQSEQRGFVCEVSSQWLFRSCAAADQGAIVHPRVEARPGRAEPAGAEAQAVKSHGPPPASDQNFLQTRTRTHKKGKTSEEATRRQAHQDKY
jgi:hypothetical protein